MSKQHLADMLKSMATNDLEAAKVHFNKYSTEKSQEILASGDLDEEPQTEEPTVEEPTAEEQATEESTETPAEDDTTEK